MNKEQRDVADFHRAMDQAIEPHPTVPSEKIVRLRAKLVTEEFLEFLDAILNWDPDVRGTRAQAEIRNALFDLIDARVPFKVDLVELADAIADLKYVLEGTHLAFGIDGEPVWDAVHASNMAKAAGAVREDGKRLKPPGWTAPDIAGILRAQGKPE